MSQENVELTRRAFQAFDDRDLDALLAMMDEAVEAFPVLAGMEGGYLAHEGIRRSGHDTLRRDLDADDVHRAIGGIWMIDGPEFASRPRGSSGS